MAKADQIKALIRSHGEGDDSRFYAIAMQVAAHAARNGHGRLAQELRDLVDRAKTSASRSGSSKPTPLAQPRGELAGLLTVSYPSLRIADVILREELHLRLERVVLEQQQRDRLRQHGFAPLRKLLLAGPPGTGKTMTAAALAGELGLPLFTVQLDGLITKYMGETAAKLRLVFDAISETRGVYLFDEFDALGGHRDTTNEVGEIRRVLNSFLQFLELDESDSLIVAATNYDKLLDKALFRRFDALLDYHLPSRHVIEQVMRTRLSVLDTSSIDWPAATAAAEGLSHAEVAHACEQAAKNAILEHSTAVSQGELLRALRDRQSGHSR